jgi:hypothetical protein
MALSEKQQGVRRGMAIGAALTLTAIAAGIAFDPFGLSSHVSLDARISVALGACLLPVLMLTASIARLAKHRFFSPQDIDGGAGMSEDTTQAQLLQTLLQNTLEQTVLALPIYLAWACIAPVAWLSVVPIVAVLFALGRLLFFAGYGHGAPARAVGFALTFYPSMTMLVSLVAYAIWRLLV